MGVNDLSINDIVVKSSTSNTACIKARFSLAIKVEALIENDTNQQDGTTSEPVGQKTIVLGYLPLDSVMHVEDSCPHEPAAQENDGTMGQTGEPLKGKGEPDELGMIVSFDCGRLAFSFRKEDNYYLNSIKGIVNLGKFVSTCLYKLFFFRICPTKLNLPICQSPTRFLRFKHCKGVYIGETDVLHLRFESPFSIQRSHRSQFISQNQSLHIERKFLQFRV